MPSIWPCPLTRNNCMITIRPLCLVRSNSPVSLARPSLDTFNVADKETKLSSVQEGHP